MPQSNPMTDAELEKLARETREWMEGSEHWEDDVQIILAALNSVRDSSGEAVERVREWLSRHEGRRDDAAIDLGQFPLRVGDLRALVGDPTAPPPPPRATGT